MRKFAFISRHVPTAEQHALAAEKEIELVHVGDRDAFTCDLNEFWDWQYDGYVVVHPALALRLAACDRPIGIFENAARPTEGGSPQFFAKALHVYHVKADSFSQVHCVRWSHVK